MSRVAKHELMATYNVEADPLSEAVRLMDEGNVAHLVVAGRERPFGVVSAVDIAGAATWGRK